MKRFIYLLIGLFLCIFANAQIERTIDGITLGVSTRQDVLNHIKTLKLPYEEIGDDIFYIGDVTYANVNWYGMNYHFYKNVVSIISFVKWAKPSYTEDDLKKEYENIGARYFLNLYHGFLHSSNSIHVLDHKTAAEARVSSNRVPMYLRLHFYDLNSKDNRYKFGNIW